MALVSTGADGDASAVVGGLLGEANVPDVLGGCAHLSERRGGACSPPLTERRLLLGGFSSGAAS